jgi:hypothetical protein
LPIKDLEKRKADNRKRRFKERQQLKTLRKYIALLNSGTATDEELEQTHGELTQ